MLELFKNEIFLREDKFFYIPVLPECFKLLTEKFPSLNALSLLNDGNFFFVKILEEDIAKKVWIACGDSSYVC